MKQENNHSPVERVVDYIKTQIAEKLATKIIYY